ncbi:N-alpha-acetyltransferase 80 [Chelonia mydas]|uniref:N-alpha-acetyltransferase 80 n=1 Tax=Chelonia mydas TaxID=8469 RepID=UPI0018A21CE5|nr:N-alpha-acetyltransferase 80 [Chelonia mydas]XP_027680136.2 N-alpha-acetyltransferase 80 [Chelonia mydas]XP_027680137.2 N-alpha-acetyltransferase 80 [Chelonia mydas]
MGSVSELLTAVPLHQRPDLVEVCAELINEEWKKSKTSRMYSLQKSTDNFPMCLVLIRTQRDTEAAEEGKMAKTQLLGHARLSRVVSQPESLFVETVVVSRALRGQGYGRKLMEATESYAKSRGFRHLHLTTHDKQHFYAHLGYTASEPVQSMGFMSSVVPMEFLQMLSSPPPHTRAPAWGPGKPSPTASHLNSRTSGANPPPLPSSTPPAHCTATVCPPPPLPPLPSSLSPPICSLNSSQSAIPPPLPLPPSPPHGSPFHCRIAAAGLPPPPPLPPPAAHVSSAHLLPPPPGPPPCHLPLLGQPVFPGPIASSSPGEDPYGQTLLETPYRDLRGLPIFWMKKDI